MALMEYSGPPRPLEDEDDEELQEKNDFDLEEAILGFVDEPLIRHDEIPNFEPYVEDDPEEWFRQRRQSEREHLRRGAGILYLGRKFFNGYAFKECVLDYALKTGFNIRQYRYDKTKIGYSCVDEKCEWRVYCSVTNSNDKWEIMVFKEEHSCIPNGECEMIKVPIIAKLFMDKLREDPEYYMPVKIESFMMENWKISVSRSQCQGARNKALRIIECEYEAQFERLRDFAADIRDSNLGSTVVIDTLQNEEGLEVFDRFFVCFDCIRRTWKETCRPLIGVDGCFMRGKMKGQVLVALGRDGNNGIYPIAWGCRSSGEHTELVMVRSEGERRVGFRRW